MAGGGLPTTCLYPALFSPTTLRGRVGVDPDQKLILGNQDAATYSEGGKAIAMNQFVGSSPADAQYRCHIRDGEGEGKIIVGLVAVLAHRIPFCFPGENFICCPSSCSYTSYALDAGGKVQVVRAEKLSCRRKLLGRLRLGRRSQSGQLQDEVVVVGLEPLALAAFPLALHLADEIPLLQNFYRLSDRVFREAAPLGDGLDAGPAFLLLPCGREQIGVDGELVRCQAIVEDGVGHLIKICAGCFHSDSP